MTCSAVLSYITIMYRFFAKSPEQSVHFTDNGNRRQWGKSSVDFFFYERLDESNIRVFSTSKSFVRKMKLRLTAAVINNDNDDTNENNNHNFSILPTRVFIGTQVYRRQVDWIRERELEVCAPSPPIGTVLCIVFESAYARYKSPPVVVGACDSLLYR